MNGDLIDAYEGRGRALTELREQLATAIASLDAERALGKRAREALVAAAVFAEDIREWATPARRTKRVKP